MLKKCTSLILISLCTWPSVFLRIMSSDAVILHKLKFVTLLHPLGTKKKKENSGNNYLLRAFTEPIALQALPPCLWCIIILLANGLLSVRDITRCSSSQKISSWDILLFRVFCLNYTREQHTFLPVCCFQLLGKRYLLKAVHTLNNNVHL